MELRCLLEPATAAVLFAITFLVCYVIWYLLFGKRLPLAEGKSIGPPVEKTILNEIMGYDFIQVKTLNMTEEQKEQKKDKPDEQKASSDKPADKNEEDENLYATSSTDGASEDDIEDGQDRRYRPDWKEEREYSSNPDGDNPEEEGSAYSGDYVEDIINQPWCEPLRAEDMEKLNEFLRNKEKDYTDPFDSEEDDDDNRTYRRYIDEVMTKVENIMDTARISDEDRDALFDLNKKLENPNEYKEKTERDNTQE